MKRKFITLITVTCTVFLLLTPVAIAANGGTPTPIAAEICNVYDDRDSIVSMTFDDGYYATALLLQELFEEYDLYASLMLIPGVFKSSPSSTSEYATVEQWTELFALGRLEPQNHSYKHKNLSSDGDISLQTESVFKSEMLDSKEILEEAFPEYDFISYAIPYGKMTPEAYAYATPIYYALRTTVAGVQTLNPDSSTNTGSWYAMHSPSVYRKGKDPTTQWATIKGDIDAAVMQKGWYLPIIHRVGDTDSADMTVDMAKQMFSYISELDKQKKVWVTTYSNAIKYVRERQNSTVYASEADGEIYVSVTMKDRADDGKELKSEIFNHPLTVKVPVPDTYGTVLYTVNGKEYSATAYSEGTQNYVKLNIAPNSGKIKLRLDSSHTYGEWETHDVEAHKRTCTDCGVIDYGEHTWDEGEIIKEATCTSVGSKSCTCTTCGDTADLVIAKNNNHDFTNKWESELYRSERKNCQHGDLYFYSCTRCAAKGKETFEVGEKEAHDFGKWKTVKPATDSEDGYMERACKNECGETEREVIPKTGKDTNPILIIGIIAGGAVALGGATAGIVIGISKKRKIK